LYCFEQAQFGFGRALPVYFIGASLSAAWELVLEDDTARLSAVRKLEMCVVVGV